MKKREEATDLDFRLWIMLRQARDAIHRARDRELRQYGTSSRQAAILYIIDMIGNRATPAEIARRQLREAHSISGILSRMEKDCLIKKTKDLERRNLVRISMTPKGRRLYIQSLKREAFHKVMSYLTDQEREDLISKLRRLRDEALNELGSGRKPPVS